MNYVCFNGQLFPDDKPILTSQNRSFKYGDGLFETIKVYREKILLKQYHFDRLIQGLRLLKIGMDDSFSLDLLSGNILELCITNHCSDLARVRLAMYRNEHDKAGYVIEAVSLPKMMNELNAGGFIIDICPDVRKHMDAYANLKSSNFLPYVLADLYAKEKGMDDCL